MKKRLYALLVAAVLAFFVDVTAALAAPRSGGSFSGRGGFRSAPSYTPRSSYGTGRSTYGGGGGSHFFFFPSFGWGWGGGRAPADQRDSSAARRTTRTRSSPIARTSTSSSSAWAGRRATSRARSRASPPRGTPAARRAWPRSSSRRRSS